MLVILFFRDFVDARLATAPLWKALGIREQETSVCLGRCSPGGRQTGQ